MSRPPALLSRHRPLRVLTLNIYEFTAPYAARMRLVRDGIRRLDPDLLAFQEAGFDGTRHQIADLLHGLGYHIIHQFEHSPRRGGKDASCIATRWPAKLVELLSLQVSQRSRDYGYAALIARVDVPAPAGPMLFVGNKPSWQLNTELEREQQAVRLTNAIRRHADPKGFPPVVAGDFDATPDSASIRFWTGRQSLAGRSTCYLDAWAEAGDGSAGHTWTWRNSMVAPALHRWRVSRRHARRIDYIFLGSRHEYAQWARFRRCRVVLNKPTRGVWPSDHFAVYAEIDVVP